MGRGFVLLALVMAPGTAAAGRTYYGWLYGTDVLPERGAEISSWIQEENSVTAAGHASESRWWIGPEIGITDQLELVLPVEIAWARADMQNGHTAFDRYGAELRYRLVTSDPVNAPPLVPLVRLAVQRSVIERDAVITELDAVASYQTGRIQITGDVGLDGEIASGRNHFEVRPGAGISIRAIGDLRFGAEVHAEITLDDGGSWAIAGPNMAWTHGRTWLSAVYGIGFHGIQNAPKVQWGIAF